jgi:hypothetical protein
VKISFFVRNFPEKLENGAIWGQTKSVILDRSSLNAQIEKGDYEKETEEVRARESRRRDSCACGQGRVLTKCE